MKYRLAYVLIVTVFSVTALTGFSYLVVHDPAADLTVHLPGTDGRPPELGRADGQVRIGEYFQAFSGSPSSLTASWPRFRGPGMDNASRESVPLVSTFEPGGPPLLWSIELGEGHAGAAVANGRVYVLDYDETRQGDALRCFSLEDGRELWRRWYTLPLKRNHGISRTVPAVTDRYVVTVGPACHVMCADAITGELRWGIDLAERFGTEVPLWYTGQCPMIDGSQAVVAVGGTALLIGVDLETGEVLWQTPNPEGYAMSHASVILMEVAGARTYVYPAIGAIVGVSAEPDSVGGLLWITTDFDATVIAPSPVYAGEDRIFQAAGYGAGSIMLRVTRDRPSDGAGAAGGRYQVQTLYRHRPTEGLACEQQTPLFYRGHLFGIMPKDAGALRGEFLCWDPEGRLVWSSGESNRFGLGPYLLADGKFFLLREDGTLVTAAASIEGYRVLGSAKILDGPDPWAPMALVSGRLLARDSRRLVCVDLRAEG